MKRKKVLALALVPTLAIALFGFNAAYAGGFGWMRDMNPEDVASFEEERFTHQAQMLGISVDKVKEGWAEGKNILEIAEANGISKEALQEKMKAERKAHMTEHLNTLVSKGVITQAQADKRLQTMESRFANEEFPMLGKGMGKGMMGRGFHRGMGF